METYQIVLAVLVGAGVVGGLLEFVETCKSKFDHSLFDKNTVAIFMASVACGIGGYYWLPYASSQHYSRSYGWISMSIAALILIVIVVENFRKMNTTYAIIGSILQLLVLIPFAVVALFLCVFYVAFAMLAMLGDTDVSNEEQEEIDRHRDEMNWYCDKVNPNSPWYRDRFTT